MGGHMKSSIYIEKIEYYIESWNNKEFEPLSSNKIPYYNKLNLFWRLRHRVNKFFKNLSSQPKVNLKDLSEDHHLMRLLDLWLGVNASEFSSSIQGSYVNSTEDFVNRVKSRWPDMTDENIFQALRNVWIMNLIQVIAETSVVLTDSMFAYSMLYPLTDNIMDSVAISKSEKQDFVERLEKRLKGESVHPVLPEELDIYSMIDLIEAQYDRHTHPKIYDSILEIHYAQSESLKQQYEPMETDDLIHTTFRKGAASVIADGYLVMGDLNSKWLDFLCGYGIVLQLADDLQDMAEDEANHHKTLFSSTLDPETLSHDTQKLIQLSQRTLRFMPCKSSWLKSQIMSLINRSMQFLISDAIFNHRSKFPKPFYKEYDKFHPIGLKNHSKLKVMCGDLMNEIKPKVTY
jgi:hypothetical protein